MTEADKWAKIYHYLEQRDADRKFRKTIDPKQITLEQCIARKLRELKNGTTGNL